MGLRLLDLFCGRWGWSRAFAARGWECLGFDIVEPPDIPEGCRFIRADVLGVTVGHIKDFAPDFIVASPPCQEFSVHGLACFHKNPPYPKLGVKLFNHTRELCEESGLPYVIENVKAAQWFVGKGFACGPFVLWGTGVPPLLIQGIVKGDRFRGMPGKLHKEALKSGVPIKEARNAYQQGAERRAGGRKHCASHAAVIPPELANCVADYAERICVAAANK